MWVDGPVGLGWDRVWHQGGRYWWFRFYAHEIQWLIATEIRGCAQEVCWKPGLLGPNPRGALRYETFAATYDAWNDLLADPLPFLMEIAL